MEFISEVVKAAGEWLAAIPFALSVTLILSGFAAAFAAFFIATLVSQRVKSAPKTGYLCICNLFTALMLAAAVIEMEFSAAVAISALFWGITYLTYLLIGILSLPPKSKKVAEHAAPVQSEPPLPKENFTPNVPAARSGVRLEHALSIADKLLLKQLGRGDRQELDKIKTTLSALRIKPTLTPQEGEILNDCFNALLKLMAKYNL